MLRYDVNSGPLTLIHDLRHLPKEEIDKLNASPGYNTNVEQTTPRSLDQNLNNQASTVGDFRYKGFVNNNFVKATFPRTIPAQSILPSSDDPKIDLKIPSPKKSVGSPQKSITSIPKSVASPPKSAGLPSPVRAANSPSKPASKGSAQNPISAMDGRYSQQSSHRRDLTSRSSQNRHQQSDHNFDPAMGPPRSNTQPQAALSPPHHPPPPEMNGYDNQGPVFDRPNGYVPTTNGHTLNGHSHGNGWARERPSPKYDSQDNPLSYRSVNQHQGTGRNYDDYETSRNVPIRNAHSKTQEQIIKETQQFLDRREEERRYKEESENRLKEKQEEQRRTREMMEESGPFGKPGAGAPNGNEHKKQKFREEQFYGREQPKYQIEPDRYVRDIENHRLHERPPEEKKKYFDDLRQQQQEKKLNGHTTNDTQNPDMAREQDQGLDGMPAFNSPGRNNMSSERQRYHHTQENLNKLRRENEMLERSSPDPFTNPDPTQHGRRLVRAWDTLELLKAPPYREAYMKQKADTGRQSNRPLSKSAMMIQEYDPWGRGIGNPLRDSAGNIARYPFALGKTREGFGPDYGHFERGKRGISSPRSAPDVDSKFLENPYNDLGRNRNVLKPNREYQLPPYYPFGKAGGGAPRKDEAGNRVTQIMGLMDRSMQSYHARKEEERMQERMMQKKYRNDLDLQVAQNMRKGEEQQRHQSESQRDYAEIIDSYRRRPQSKHHLPRSDISLARDGVVPLDRREADKYRESLDEGYISKQTKLKLDKMKEHQQSRQHVQKMTSYWGQLGGGYRKNHLTTHKGNLDRLLNNEDGKVRFSMTDVYLKGKDWSQFDEKTPRGDGFTSGNAAPNITPRFASQDDVSPRYSRVTVDSYHANQYDYPYTVPTLKKDYEMKLPWAQH